MHTLYTIGLLLGCSTLLHMKTALFHSLHSRFFIETIRNADHSFLHDQIYSGVLYRRLPLQYVLYRGGTG